jgi:hypothetical protein
VEKRYYFYTAIVFIIGILIGGGATWYFVSRAENNKYSALISSTNNRESELERQLKDSEKRSELLAAELDRSNSLVSEITKLNVSGTKHIEGVSQAITDCFDILDRIDGINKDIDNILNNRGKLK